MDLCLPTLQRDEKSYSVLRCEGSSVTLPNLAPGTMYLVSIKALTHEGYGDSSLEHEFETLAEGELLGGSKRDQVAASPPSRLGALLPGNVH